MTALGRLQATQQTRDWAKQIWFEEYIKPCRACGVSSTGARAVTHTHYDGVELTVEPTLNFNEVQLGLISGIPALLNLES